MARTGFAPSGAAPEFLRRKAAVLPVAPKPLTQKPNVWGCCAAVAAALVLAFPVAQGISAVSQSPIPVQQVNRAAKGDLLAKPRNAIHKVPLQTVKDPARPVRDQSDKRIMMDGCESSFSPVTVPSMAHIAGRCVG